MLPAKVQLTSVNGPPLDMAPPWFWETLLSNRQAMSSQVPLLLSAPPAKLVELARKTQLVRIGDDEPSTSIPAPTPPFWLMLLKLNVHPVNVGEEFVLNIPAPCSVTVFAVNVQSVIVGLPPELYMPPPSVVPPPPSLTVKPSRSAVELTLLPVTTW